MTPGLRSLTIVAVALGSAACTGADDDGTGSVPDTAVEATGSTPDAEVEGSPSAGSTGGDAPSPATDPPTTDVAVPGVQPEGFTTATVRITEADGEVCEVCMWLADESDERGAGLMGVTDLGEPAGMAFVFDQPVEGAFFMLGTPTPLSIAWFAADGAFVSATDMEPCGSALAANCERFRADGAYQLAIEVFEGGLDDLGIGTGSIAEVVAGSESPTCVLVAES